jgi:ferredoxin-NADP reductase
MMTIIRALLAAPAEGRIALLYSNRCEAEVMFGDELLRLEKDHPERLSATHVLTQQRDGSTPQACATGSPNCDLPQTPSISCAAPRR